MKPQDILFFFILLFLIYKKSQKLAVFSGLICIVIAIPLFSFWVFFTAERLTWYAAAFFLLAGVLILKKQRKV